jgi:hypothetical protein
MYLNLSAYNKSKRRKSKKVTGEVYEKYTPPKFESFRPTSSTYYRETPKYPSVTSNAAAVCSRPERKKYTGTLVTGIATMHKSNAVPIINQQEAIDIARMRHG